jgi:phospholipid/cholesterol/gamma-HCH transport system substrate-binding protein
MSVFKAGILAITTLALLAYFGFTKANPFANPYELKAMFRDVESLKPNSPVRIAGVEVGKVKKVEPKQGGGAAEVTMELRNDALPIHKDARVQIRSRIFLEGNFFVDI